MSTMMLLKYFTPMSIIWVCFFEMAAEQSAKCTCQYLSTGMQKRNNQGISKSAKV